MDTDLAMMDPDLAMMDPAVPDAEAKVPLDEESLDEKLERLQRAVEAEFEANCSAASDAAKKAAREAREAREATTAEALAKAKAGEADLSESLTALVAEHGIKATLREAFRVVAAEVVTNTEWYDPGYCMLIPRWNDPNEAAYRNFRRSSQSFRSQEDAETYWHQGYEAAMRTAQDHRRVELPEALESDCMWSDRVFVLTLMKVRGYELCYASLELRNDREVVLAAIKSHAKAYSYASKSLQMDPTILMAAIRSDVTSSEVNCVDVPTIRFELNDLFRIWDDRVTPPPALHGSPVPNELRSNKKLMLAAIEVDREVFDYVSEELKTDREFVHATGLHRAIKHWRSSLSPAKRRWVMAQERVKAYCFVRWLAKEAAKPKPERMKRWHAQMQAEMAM